MARVEASSTYTLSVYTEGPRRLRDLVIVPSYKEPSTSYKIPFM